MAEEPLKLYSHSTLLYWWPVWLVSLALGIWSLLVGERVAVGDDTMRVLPSASLGFLFGVVLLIVSVVTTVKMKGIRSVVLVLTILLVTVFAAWAGVLDEFFSIVPAMSTHLSAGFLLTFGAALLAVWFCVVFIFDRLAYWRISEGQLVRVKVIGAAEKAYDARGLTVEHQADDLLRHVVFGLGSGDIILRTGGAENAVVPLLNVLFVDDKINRIQHLVSIEPDG